MRVEINFTDDQGAKLASFQGPANGKLCASCVEGPRPRDEHGKELIAFEYAGLVVGDGWKLDDIPPRWLGEPHLLSPAKDNTPTSQ